MNRRWIALPVVAAALVGPVVGGQERVDEGRRVFVEQGCHGCHTVGKLGTPIAPDLSHIGARYSGPALERWLRDPAMQRPTAHMPKLELSESQVLALAAFLASLE